MRDEDRIRIRHMLDAAREAMTFAAGRDRSNLDTDRMLLLSLVKCVEILGEAASRVSEEVKAASPDFPWRDIVAMRNRLIHGYFDIDPDIVWSTVIRELPDLLPLLEDLLGQDPPGDFFPGRG
jgi:uncharacterized protein with HEPN domain